MYIIVKKNKTYKNKYTIFKLNRAHCLTITKNSILFNGSISKFIY